LLLLLAATMLHSYLINPNTITTSRTTSSSNKIIHNSSSHLVLS
jgi:hypothetical protein